jgi:short-subunit dehydrogenase
MGRRTKGAVTILTGASTGIGRATAVRLAQAGARLVLVSRSAERLDPVVEEIRAGGGEAFAGLADVTRREDIDRVVAVAMEKFGRVDVAICNAGELVRRPARLLRFEEIRRMIEVNYYGMIHLILAVLPGMLERRHGHIVAVTSVDGRKGLPLDAAYVASKFAATGFMDVLRQELRGTGVYASTVLPGRVDTPMIAHLEVPVVSAKIPPDRVARAIVRAVDQRRREVIIPFWGPKALVVANMFSPALGDTLVRWFRLEGVETEGS